MHSRITFSQFYLATHDHLFLAKRPGWFTANKKFILEVVEIKTDEPSPNEFILVTRS